MRLTSIALTTALGFAAGATAWAQAEDGTWIANDVYYDMQGFHVAEACTERNTNNIHASGSCSYWADAHGTIIRGSCSIFTILDPFWIICD